MRFLDAVYHWYDSLAETILLGRSDWLAFPLFGVSVVLALNVAVRLATGFGAQTLLRLAVAGCVACHLVLLSAEYAVTRLIRLMGGRPPAVVYAFGDGLNRALPRVLDVIRAAAAWWRRESYVLNHHVLLVVVALVVIGLWNGTYCDRIAISQPCDAPSTGFADTLSGWFARTPPGQ